MKMKILITGSSGLIGTAICQKIFKKGFEPVTMDIKQAHDPDFQPQFSDINDPIEVKKAIKDVQGVIHLAAVSRVIDGEKHPTLCRKTNIHGSDNIIKAAANSPRHPWVIYGSSREIYGEPAYLPVPETHSLSPINVYGETKAHTEKKLQQLATQSGVNSIIFRYSNVYGSALDHKTRVIPAFMRAALNDHPLRIDCPDHIFDFTYVEDVAEATIRGAEALSNGHIEGCPEFNVSPGTGTSLLKLVELISKVTEKEITTVPGKRRDYDVGQYIGDVNKIETILNYRCQTSLKDGLGRLHADYLETVEA